MFLPPLRGCRNVHWTSDFFFFPVHALRSFRGIAGGCYFLLRYQETNNSRAFLSCRLSLRSACFLKGYPDQIYHFSPCRQISSFALSPFLPALVCQPFKYRPPGSLACLFLRFWLEQSTLSFSLSLSRPVVTQPSSPPVAAAVASFSAGTRSTYGALLITLCTAEVRYTSSLQPTSRKIELTAMAARHAHFSSLQTCRYNTPREFSLLCKYWYSDCCVWLRPWFCRLCALPDH